MTNPLIDKYNELYNPKPPEPPKPVEKPVKLITYDPDSVNVSFHQVAEKLKTGNAQVVSMSMERDIMSGTKITFEVYVDD